VENRKRRLILIALVISFAINTGLAIFVAIIAISPRSSNQVKSVEPAASQITTAVDYQLLNEVLAYIDRDYFYSDNLTPQGISRGAAKGIVQSLGDKYSVFLDPATTKQESTSYSGSYKGIGAYIGTDKNNQIVIISPMDNSPAKEAGLKSGDVILKINDIVTSDLSVTEASLTIQGEAGSEVTLLILREGVDTPFEVKLTRRAITIQSVYYEINNGIAYIRISQFLQNTGSELHKDLQEINKQKVNGIILDLRDDPGGLLDQAIDVASEFLESGIVVKSLDNQ
jgi:carboxyl-terminal processing protease